MTIKYDPARMRYDPEKMRIHIHYLRKIEIFYDLELAYLKKIQSECTQVMEAISELETNPTEELFEEIGRSIDSMKSMFKIFNLLGFLKDLAKELADRYQPFSYGRRTFSSCIS
ncbi:hypothetical protein RB195_021599 [Necator americanus]|uniref:Uncharacterized protein n=1 Tax=Necator americanus TaxID=51031 RepID=A0ABR1EBU0_NECAM